MVFGELLNQADRQPVCSEMIDSIQEHEYNILDPVHNEHEKQRATRNQKSLQISRFFGYIYQNKNLILRNKLNTLLKQEKHSPLMVEGALKRSETELGLNQKTQIHVLPPYPTQ